MSWAMAVEISTHSLPFLAAAATGHGWSTVELQRKQQQQQQLLGVEGSCGGCTSSPSCSI